MNPRELHRDAVVVDCHNDLAISLWLRDLYPRRGTMRHRWIPELRQGGVDVQILPIYVEPEIPEGALRMALQMLQRSVDEIELNPEDAALCLSAADIDTAVAAGKIAFILALEGFSQFATDIGLVRTFHRLGVRMISFTHFGRTLLADGSAEEGAGSRLTRMGVEVFTEMEHLGIVMDVSHLSQAGTDHVLELATKPVIASHSNARAVWNHHRNIPDTQLAAIAESGGVVGLNAHPLLVDGRKQTIDRLMDHLEHMIEIAGVDHVGLGPDFIRDIMAELHPSDADLSVDGIQVRDAIEGVVNARDLPVLTEQMLLRGLGESDIRKILGGNFLRVFNEVLVQPAGRGSTSVGPEIRTIHD
ncbi:MAG: dipeptidase [Candidatus Dormibacteria bacterium]